MKKYILLCISFLSTQAFSQDFINLPMVDKVATSALFIYGIELAGFALICSCQSWIDAVKWFKHNDDCQNCERCERYKHFNEHAEETSIATEHIQQLSSKVKTDIGKMAFCSILSMALLRAAQRLAKA